MTLDQFFTMCKNERRRRGVAFVMEPVTFAIGTSEPSFRSPLEFLADCCYEAGDGQPMDIATLVDCLGMVPHLIEQLIIASDGGCSGYLRDRLEDACGLRESVSSEDYGSRCSA